MFPKAFYFNVLKWLYMEERVKHVVIDKKKLYVSL